MAMGAAALMIPAAVTIVILLLNPAGCSALAASKPLLNDTSSSNWPCALGSGKCLIGDGDIDSEFLMESHVSRMLAEKLKFETMTTPNANMASVVDCERPPRYDSCLGDRRDIPPPENCDAFNRVNPC